MAWMLGGHPKRCNFSFSGPGAACTYLASHIGEAGRLEAQRI